MMSDGGSVEDYSNDPEQDMALDPQSSIIAQVIKRIASDRADPNDTQGIEPVSSPIDLAAGAAGGALADAAMSPSNVGEILGNQIGARDKAAMITNQLNRMSAAKNRAISQLVNPADDLLSTLRVNNINNLGKNSPDIAPKPQTVQGYLDSQIPTKDIQPPNNVVKLDPTQTLTPQQIQLLQQMIKKKTQ